MSADGASRIDLSIPGQPSLLQLVRLTAGVVAARLDLRLDQIEDLRLAVDELCLPFVDGAGPSDRLVVHFAWDDHHIRISCATSTDASGPRAGDPAGTGGSSRAGRPPVAGRKELSSQILDALVDEHGESDEEGRPGAWLLLKRRAAAPG